MEVEKEKGNDNWKQDFSLECGKLNKMDTFREMTDSELTSGLFQFCPFCFVLEVNRYGRHKVRCVAGGSKVEHVHIDIRAI